MATSRNKRKLAAVTRETQEERPRNGQSRNTSVPRINEEYITQVSEEIENRVTRKLFQEFSRTESRFLGALSKLDEFLLNPQIWTHSGTVPGTFRNTNVENQQERNEDRSQDDPHPEVRHFVCQSRHSIDSESDKAPHNSFFQFSRLREQVYRKQNCLQRVIVPFHPESQNGWRSTNGKILGRKQSYLQRKEVVKGNSKIILGHYL